MIRCWPVPGLVAVRTLEGPGQRVQLHLVQMRSMIHSRGRQDKIRYYRRCLHWERPVREAGRRWEEAARRKERVRLGPQIPRRRSKRQFHFRIAQGKIHCYRRWSQMVQPQTYQYSVRSWLEERHQRNHPRR